MKSDKDLLRDALVAYLEQYAISAAARKAENAAIDQRLVEAAKTAKLGTALLARACSLQGGHRTDTTFSHGGKTYLVIFGAEGSSFSESMIRELPAPLLS